METNTLPIDTHLKELIQRSITHLDAIKSSKVIEEAVTRIRHDLDSRRGRKTKFRKIPLQLKRRWIQRTSGTESMTRRHPYTATPWVTPLKVIIADEKFATRNESTDRSNPH